MSIPQGSPFRCVKPTTDKWRSNKTAWCSGESAECPGHWKNWWDLHLQKGALANLGINELSNFGIGSGSGEVIHLLMAKKDRNIDTVILAMIRAVACHSARRAWPSIRSNKHDRNENPSLGIYNIKSIYDNTPCEHHSLDLFTASQRRTQPFTKRHHRSEIDNNNASRVAILATMADLPLCLRRSFFCPIQWHHRNHVNRIGHCIHDYFDWFLLQ